MISNNNKSTPEHPLVTIVALCYNQAQYAEETLDSILAQTYPNIQLIIMDDASSDNSVEVINNWIDKNKVDCTFITHEENQGICRTLNEALSHSKGDYFEMVACDDLYLPEKTEIQVNYLQTNKDAAMVYTDAYLIQADSSPHYGWFIQRHRSFAALPSGNIYEELLKNNFIPAMSSMTETKIIKELGGWDENLVYEDYDFWLRLAKDYSISVIDKPLVKYRLHGNNFHSKYIPELSNFWIYSKHCSNEAGRKKFQEVFFSLYRKGLASKAIKDKYTFIFKNKMHSKLIKTGLSYPIYKFIISLY